MAPALMEFIYGLLWETHKNKTTCTHTCMHAHTYTYTQTKNRTSSKYRQYFKERKGCCMRDPTAWGGENTKAEMLRLVRSQLGGGLWC